MKNIIRFRRIGYTILEIKSITNLNIIHFHDIRTSRLSFFTQLLDRTALFLTVFILTPVN